MSKILAESQGETAERILPVKHQLEVLSPLLRDGLVHLPFWSVMATRLD
jgi:hypothetical protein